VERRDLPVLEHGPAACLGVHAPPDADNAALNACAFRWVDVQIERFEEQKVRSLSTLVAIPRIKQVPSASDSALIVDLIRLPDAAPRRARRSHRLRNERFRVSRLRLSGGGVSKASSGR
jgi:hypothetical protein